MNFLRRHVEKLSAGAIVATVILRLEVEGSVNKICIQQSEH